jgi:hypothetical protein
MVTYFQHQTQPSPSFPVHHDDHQFEESGSDLESLSSSKDTDEERDGILGRIVSKISILV